MKKLKFEMKESYFILLSKFKDRCRHGIATETAFRLAK